MSHILCQWLNNDLSLPKKMEPTSLEESLRSGYVFAAILNQYQLIENIAAFQNSTSTDVSIKNYTLLEPVLRAIGVNLSATTAYELISGKPGVGERVLYQVKSSLLNISAQNLDEAIKAYKHRPFVQLKMKQKGKKEVDGRNKF